MLCVVKELHFCNVDCANYQKEFYLHLFEGYSGDDIFNADETGLFLKYLRNKIVILKQKHILVIYEAKFALPLY